MKCYYIESTEYNPWNNLALEAAIADRIVPGDIYLYLWQNNKTVVIGKGQNALRECKGELLEREGGYLARRTTGGGAVYHDLGNLCFTFAASPEIYDLRRQMQVVMDACASFGILTELSGRNDITTEDGYKFSGNAFSVSKNYQIQHGTLMLDVNREALQRYLTPSPLKLRAKGIASVQSRVCNLKELNPHISVEGLKAALRTAFEKEYGACEELTPGQLDQSALTGYQEKFSSWEWRYGKSPACEIIYETLLPFGEVQIQLHLEGMVIREALVYTDCLETEYAGRMREQLLGLRHEAAAFLEMAERLQSSAQTADAASAGQAPSVREMEAATLRWLAESCSQM